MSTQAVVGIAVASTTAFAAYIYKNYCRDDPEVEEIRARLNRSIRSFEESGIIQRQYLDEFKEDLGGKNFFFGDQMTGTDLQIFGQLASIYYVPNTEPVVNLLNEDYLSLVSWMERVRQQICSKDFRRPNQ